MNRVTDEELLEITGLRTKLANVMTETGQTALQLQLLESDVLELKNRMSEQTKTFKQLIDEEEKLITRLSEKYGTGSINFETGEFTPDR